METASQSLVQLLSRFVPVDEAMGALLRETFEAASYEKGAALVEIGRPARYMFFVVSGFARAFHFQDGAEITNHLTGPGKFITAYASFATGEPADEGVQAVTACDVLRATKPALDAMYRRSHPLALFGLMLSEQYLLFNNRRGKELISLSARERYLKLLDEEPELVQHVPLQYVASYIGVKPESLSRIRRQIFS